MPTGEESQPAAANEGLFDRFYDELRSIARRYMLRERVDHTLQPTALVNEAFLRLATASPYPIENRTHFLRLAARTMRRILVDHAREKHAQRRGGELARVTFTDVLPADDKAPSFDIIALDAALDRLASIHERQSTVIDLRFFAGLTVDETAAELGTSPRTIKGDTRVAMAWLRRELSR